MCYVCIVQNQPGAAAIWSTKARYITRLVTIASENTASCSTLKVCLMELNAGLRTPELFGCTTSSANVIRWRHSLWIAGSLEAMTGTCLGSAPSRFGRAKRFTARGRRVSTTQSIATFELQPGSDPKTSPRYRKRATERGQRTSFEWVGKGPVFSGKLLLPRVRPDSNTKRDLCN